MPGFAGRLSDDDRWALLDYVRAHQAGMAMRQAARFDGPVRAPAIGIACDGIAATQLSDLAGRTVHVVTEGQAVVSVPAQLGVPTVTLVLAQHGVPAAASGTCGAADPAAWDAYAVLAGCSRIGWRERNS